MKNKITTREYNYECGKCKQGTIMVKQVDRGEMVTLEIKKCTNKSCKHQYYLKELKDLKLNPI